jgi:hypothetical protein
LDWLRLAGFFDILWRLPETKGKTLEEIEQSLVRSKCAMTQSAEGVPQMTGIKTVSGHGFGRIILDNGVARVVVLPDLGGKIISLVRIASGREYLISFSSNEDFRKPSFGGTFVDYNNVGFDECIPTIAPCDYPESKFAGF